MTLTPFSRRYGSSPCSVSSARLSWQYDSTASTVPRGTLAGQRDSISIRMRLRPHICCSQRFHGLAKCELNNGIAANARQQPATSWRSCQNRPHGPLKGILNAFCTIRLPKGSPTRPCCQHCSVCISMTIPVLIRSRLRTLCTCPARTRKCPAAGRRSRSRESDPAPSASATPVWFPSQSAQHPPTSSARPSAPPRMACSSSSPGSGAVSDCPSATDTLPRGAQYLLHVDGALDVMANDEVDVLHSKSLKGLMHAARYPLCREVFRFARLVFANLRAAQTAIIPPVQAGTNPSTRQSNWQQATARTFVQMHRSSRGRSLMHRPRSCAQAYDKWNDAPQCLQLPW